MPQISIIVPVYNTEKYIGKCLNSILNQTMQDFEIIIVNDGSTDNSESVIKEYIEKYPNKIKYYKKENEGVSVARNVGIKKASGDYLCFVDSDDYIDLNLFESLQPYILKKIDLIKYKCIKVNENNEKVEKVLGPIFEMITGEQGFNVLYSEDVFLELAWLYLYKRDFFEYNNFEFPIEKFHEDWAIVPYMIVNAKTIVSTNVYGYYYVQTENSITRNKEDIKIYKRVKDMLAHYDEFSKKVLKLDLQKNTIENYYIYMTNCLILKLEELPKEYHKEYIEELKKRKLWKNIKCRNLKQLIKKIFLLIDIKLYLKIR